MRYGVVALLAATISFGREARADEPAATEIIVRGSPRTIPGTTTQVMTETAIERSGATNVGQALETLPVVQAASDSRGERVISLQGFSQRQVAVFVDGVPVLVPYDGQLDLSKFPVDMIDRITIVKGASSTLCGPNGLGGAINLSTREPRERAWVRARTEGGANATRSSLTVSGTGGAFGGIIGGGFERVRFVPMSHSFSGSPNEDGGRRNNSDRLAGTVAAKSTIDLDASHRIVVTASRFEGEFGVPPATKDFSVRYWRWTDWYSTALGVGHEYRGKRFESQVLAYAGLVGNTLDGYDDARYATQLRPRALHSVYDDVSLGVFHRTTIHLADAPIAPKVRTWIGYKRDLHTSFDNTNPAKVSVATNLVTLSAAGEIDPVPKRVRTNAGLAFDVELPDRPDVGPAPKSSAGVGPLGSVTWMPHGMVDVTASAALRTRMPTLRERFSTVFGTREPNVDLAPERAVNLGLDVAVKPTRELRVAVGAFDSEVRDLITAVFVRPQVEQQQNVGKARFYGAELQTQWSATKWLDLTLGGLLLHAKSGPNLDRPVEYRPSQRGLAIVTVKPVASVALSAIGRYVGPQEYANPNTGVFAELDPYALLDARVDWTILPVLRLYARMQNVTDANVEGRFSFPEAGRQFFVGLVGESP